MGENGTVWLPEAASTLAPAVDSLFYFVYWISVFIFFGVVSAMGYFILLYRRRTPQDKPKRFHVSQVMEMTWVVIPTILCLIVFTWGFQTYVKIYTAPPDAYKIQVRGQQWAWEFEYPNGKKTINEFNVPVDRPVQLTMSSSDVLHSFFVPAFRVKMDVLPNRYTSVWFEATRVDSFDVFCTEFCGTAHSGMIGKVVVQPEAEFTTWVNTSDDMSPAERGQQLYTQLNCVVCHSNDGTEGPPFVGPTFQGLFGRQRPLADGSTVEADENYIRESILQPTAKVAQGFPPAMPPFGTLDAAQVDALIAYIQSLAQ